MAKKLHWTWLAICAVLRFLRDSDGSASSAEVMAHIEDNKIPEEKDAGRPDFAKWWKGRVGDVAYNLVLAGLLRREKGVWSITPLGEKTLESGEDAIVKDAKAAWKKYVDTLEEKQKEAGVHNPDANGDENGSSLPVDGDRMEGLHTSANEGITCHIKKMGPFAVQDLVAALLRGMGYYVHKSQVSQPNAADGGIDVVAYQGGDSFGAKTPRIKVQVKHGKQVGENALRDILSRIKDGEAGLLVSTGGFAGGCRKFARNEHRQLELIDMPRFIELWRDNYDKLSDEDKSLLPLQPIYFLDEGRAKRA